MKFMKLFGFYLIVLLCSSLFFCTQGKKQFGKSIDNKTITNIDLLTKDWQTYQNKHKLVTVQGRVIQVAPDGTWFTIKGEYESRIIDTSKGGFTVRDIMGREVLAQGEVYIYQMQAKLLASGVEVIE